VLASVSRLRPRLGSFHEAVVAFRAASLQQCLSELHGLESVAARTLRARTLLRLGDPRAGLTALAGSEPETNQERAEVALLQAVAHFRLEDDKQPGELLRDAFVYSVSATDLALEAEVHLYKALSALGKNDVCAARDLCQTALEVAHTPQYGNLRSRSQGIVPLEHVVSRAQELLGIIAATEGLYQASMEHAREALITLDRCAIPDVFQQAFALRNLAIHSRDFDIEADARMLALRVPALAWTEDIGRVEFTTYEALGWCAALRGKSVEALRFFRRAEAVATTDPERILVGVDRALFAREFGHKPMACEEVEHALNLADAFDWEHAAGDYRVALLTLAQVAAPVATLRARQTLDRHTAIRNAMEAGYAARLEPRARAEEAYTHGLVLRAEGRLTASAERLQCAFETWASIGYEWRAARAALELTELNAGDVFRLAVRRELFQRPNSVFSERARLVA